MRKKTRTFVAIILVTITTLTVTVAQIPTPTYAGVPGEPHDADAMWIEPSTIDLSTESVSVGYCFNVTVWVNSSVEECAGWQFELAYNKAHLNAIDCGYTAGGKSQFFEDIATMALTPTLGSFNATHNFVLYAELWGLSGPFRGPGYGSLAYVTFNVTAVPPEGVTWTSTIGLVEVYPQGTETYLQDSSQTKIPLNVYTTTYRISSPGAPPPPPGNTTLYVDPPNITDPTMSPCSTFTINITIANVSDLVVCKFNLTYDSDIIGWMGMNVFKVQNQTPAAQVMLDDEAGFIWVKLKYPAPVTTECSPLVGLLFHVEAYGATILDLHDTELTDSTGEPIPHETRDAFFCTLIRDVAVTNVFPSKNWTYVGGKLNVTVTAKNEGAQSETFTVSAYYDETQIGNITVQDLQPGQEATLIFLWDTQNTTACSNYTVSAEASTVPFELDTTDNKHIDGWVKVRILGDVTGDDKVRLDDIYLAVEAFASESGDPKWNPAADMNGDGRVRVDDILTIALNFGKDCPT